MQFFLYTIYYCCNIVHRASQTRHPGTITTIPFIDCLRKHLKSGHGVLDYQNLTNLELVRLIAEGHDIEWTWREFEKRFNPWISQFTYKECNARIKFRSRDMFLETVADLVQDIKVKLISKDFKAFKSFRGRNERSIYDYLKKTSRNTVLNYIYKNKPEKFTTKDQSNQDVLDLLLRDDGANMAAKDSFISNNVELDMDYESVVIEINDILNKIHKGRNKARNILIIQLYLFEELSVDEIFDFFHGKMEMKTIRNIISETKAKIREELFRNRGGKK